VRIMAPNGQSRTVSIVGNPYYFAGRRLDGQTGLYYYRARYYSPEIARFPRTETLGPARTLRAQKQRVKQPPIR
ncbi:MAG: hypothetical protein JSU94_07975, partial [Phycisphaerales bacterium]